jgi:hypothetical protein
MNKKLFDHSIQGNSSDRLPYFQVLIIEIEINHVHSFP